LYAAQITLPLTPFISTGMLHTLLLSSFRPFFLLATILTAVAAGCSPSSQSSNAAVDRGDRPLRIVATTSIIADLVETIGGDRLEVEGLMGPGVDPHLYKASEGEVIRVAQAEVVFATGLQRVG
jgi:manganese/zinc/iron transport system substrate-binding protein